MARTSILLFILAVCVGAAVHDNSWSTTRVTLNEAGVEVALAVQTLSVIEVTAADQDGDAWLTAEELDASRAEVVAYLAEHHVVSTIDAGGVSTPISLDEPTFERREDLDSLPPMQWLEF